MAFRVSEQTLFGREWVLWQGRSLEKALEFFAVVKSRDLFVMHGVMRYVVLEKRGKAWKVIKKTWWKHGE